MKDHENIHLKVQDLCACFSGTDPLKEMSTLSRESDTREAALKWLALAALHGINSNAEKISLKADDNGGISVTAQYRKTQLPSPGEEAGARIIEAIQEITHITEEKGKTKLALGIMDSSVELTVGIKDKKGKQKISLKFP